MALLHEFKAFAIKGNVVDLAVGVVIGTAFSKIVTSFVDDLVTPALLTPALKAARLTDLNQLVIPGTAIKYGNFVSTLISFTIIAFVLFVFIRGINAMKQRAESAAPPPVPSSTDALLTEIKNLLQQQANRH